MQALKRNWKLIFGITMVVLFVVGTILKLITPATAPVLNAVSTAQAPTIKKQTSFTGAVINLPKTAPTVATTQSIYYVTNAPVSLTILGAKLNLQSADQGVTWYSDSGETLSQDPYSNRIGYSNLGTEEATDSAKLPPVNVETATSVATAYLANKLQITTLVADAPNITLKQTGYEDDYYDVGKADIAVIPFVYQVGGQPVFTDSDLFPQMTVQVNSLGKILNFTMAPNLITAVTQEVKVKTLPFEQIKNQILANKVGVLQISSESPDGFTIQKLKQLDITSATVEYRLNTASSQVLPYYRLFSTATLLSGTVSQLQLITPAVVTTP